MDIINIILINPWSLLIGAGVLGLIIGSFLNVVIYRLPLGLKASELPGGPDPRQHPLPHSHPVNLVTPRSFCPACQKPIPWWHNIPLISYLILKGRCRNCHTTIPWRYPCVEALSCIATMFILAHFGPTHIKTLPLLILTWTLIAASFIDLEHQLLPDNLTLPLLWLGLLLNVNYIFTSPANAIIGAAGGYLFLWIIAKVFKLIRQKEGMGYGDFKLLAGLGAWHGWQGLPAMILIASLAGLLVGLGLLLRKKHQFNQPLPFGPYLAVAGWLLFFIEQPFAAWYYI